MIRFDEPDDPYDLEKVRKRDSSQKIRVATLLVVFSLILVFFVRNDFDFNFAKTEAAAFSKKCENEEMMSMRDDEVLRFKKAEKLLDENLKHFQGLEGFSEAEVELKAVGHKEAEVPVIKLEFEETSSAGKKMPEKICGFQVVTIYK